MTSEGETLILKKTSTEICCDEKTANNGSKEFQLTTKFYNSASGATILVPMKWNPKGKAALHPEGTDFKKQENRTTKQIMMYTSHSNKLSQ